MSIARQIAKALDIAHEKGIIHRDLKPANITITPDGVVKVLDFGLAKAVGGGPTADLTHSPTKTANYTSDGAVMGTPRYMSPEQTRGQVVDKRTDIWAFGCVLYEMLTGRVAFQGGTPASVRMLLQRCLDKDPKHRLRDLGDVRFEIDDVVRHAATWTRWPNPAYRAVLPSVVALVLLASGAVLFYVGKPPAPVTLPSEYIQLTNFTDSATAPSLSPDGRMVTFKLGGTSFLSPGQIFVKLLPNGDPVQLTTSAGRKYGPVFTPDGSRVAYTEVASDEWDTWTVPVLGGHPVRFLPNASGLIWIADHRVLFSEIKTGIHMGIVTATDNRADLREIYIHPDEHAMAHYSYASPDRQSVLVVEMSGAHAFSQPCPDGTRVFYLFARDWWLAAKGWSPASADVRSVDLTSGKNETVLSDQSVTNYVISRDQKDVAFTTSDADGASQIWLAPLDRRTPPRRIASDGDQVSFGAAGELIFRSLREGNALVRIKTDGTGRERIPSVSVLEKGDVSPDGAWVIIRVPETDLATLAVPIHGGIPRMICHTCSARWSTDGKFFYVGSELNASAPSAGKTLAIPVPAGQSLPDLPAKGINVADGTVGLPGAVTIEYGLILPGPDPSTYLFTRTDSQRNLFRIPLH